MKKPLVIITGASGGIGFAIAKIFSQAGHPLALLARNLEKMQSLNLPNTLCQSVDVTDFDAMKNAVANAEKQYGPVNCLVNNAGMVAHGDYVDIDHGQHDKLVDVNVRGVMNGMQVVLPSMRKQQSGTILNISSVADRNLRPMLAVYAATKAAVKSLSASLSEANAEYGIRICNVAPAKIKTEMIISANLDDGKTIEPQEFAEMALWIYQQPEHICVRDIVVAPTKYTFGG